MSECLVLPSGIKLQAETETELWQAIFRHSVAALSEQLCPQCSGPLNLDTCYGGVRHRPILWHLCPDRQNVAEYYLDLPLHVRRDLSCERCGWLFR